MSATPEQHRQAADPATSAQELADLAAAHPELQPVIAANPATYDGLLDWLRQYGGPEVQAALAARSAAAPAAPPPPPAEPAAPAAAEAPSAGAAPAPSWTPAAAPVSALPSGVRWQEPSRSIPIRWLNHDLRYTLALVALGVAGLFHLVISPLLLGAIRGAIYWNYAGIGTDLLNAFVTFLLSALPLLLVGAAIFVLPSRRRSTMLALGLAAIPLVLLLLRVVFLLIYQSNGGYIFRGIVEFLYVAGLLGYPAILAAWLIARMRPPIALTLLPATLLAILLTFFPRIAPGVLPGDFGYGLDPIGVILTLLAIGTLVGIAWLARLIAQRNDLGPAAPAYGAPAYAATGAVAPAPGYAPGAPGSPGAAPSSATPGYPVMPVARTNTMAILALVFGIGGGWLGILFGHLALSQIKRTGEQGRGLALAGLICGYIGAGFWLIVIIISIAVSASTSYYYW